MENTQRKVFTKLFIGLAVFTYLLGLLIDVINVDSAQYASISLEMLEQDNWLFLFERGQDYLDKPPLIFWLSALSYKMFGINALTFKLPSFIFSILGVYATQKLGALLYSKRVGYLSSIFLVGTLGFIYLNLDVKTDVILCGAVIFSVYQLILYLRFDRIKNLIWASVFIGFALLTKGPLGLMVPVFAIAPELIYKKQWQKFIDPKWLLALLIVALMLLPMCMGLYQQFDLQPEKIVNGKTGVSGLRFYFWEQSFGRITGENKWSNDSGYFYFVHTALLFLLPWSVIFLLAYFRKLKNFFAQKEILTISGATLTIAALSLSHYKLPHYVFVVFPLLSIIAASEYFHLIRRVRMRKVIHFAALFFTGLFLFASVLSFVLFQPEQVLAYLWLVPAIAIPLFVLFKVRSKVLRPVWISAFGLMGFALILNGYLLPRLLDYQADEHISALIREQGIPADKVFFYDRNSRRLEFNLRKRIPVLSLETIREQVNTDASIWLYMTPDAKEALRQQGLEIKQNFEFEHIGMNRFTIDFLNPATREDTFERRVLVEVGK